MGRPPRLNKKTGKIRLSVFHDELWRITSLLVRVRDRRCVVCGVGEWDTIQAGHLLSRSFHPVRYRLDNIYGQCAGCNMWHENDPEKMKRIVIRMRGQGWFDALYADANGPPPQLREGDIIPMIFERRATTAELMHLRGIPLQPELFRAKLKYLEDYITEKNKL